MNLPATSIRGIIDENFQIRLDTGDKYVELHQISQGTVEQVYFALRMAAGELFMPGRRTAGAAG